MGRPLKSDGRQTRQAILDQGLALFAQKGYFGTSLRDIAGAVGVRESALYNYFPGKEALFIALIDAVHEQRAEQISLLMQGPQHDPRLLLERLTALVLDEFATSRQQMFFRVLMSDGLRLAREGRINLIDRMTSGAAPLRQLMSRLVAGGHLRRQAPDVLALEFMGPLLMWRHWHALNPERRVCANHRTFVRQHVAHFLHGAAPQPSLRSAPRAPRRAGPPAVSSTGRVMNARSRQPRFRGSR